jgi:hypothetical protein
MSSYHDPALRGDVYPSEEEIDPADAGVEPASDAVGPAEVVTDRDGRLDTGAAPPDPLTA